MKQLLLIFALALPVSASTLLTIGTLQNPVPQSVSTPCIICGSTQAHNPAFFGYNQFDTTGKTGSLTLFSTNLFESLGDGVQEVLLNNYTTSEIIGVLANHFTFGVAIDVNSAEGGNPPTIMQLQSFQLLDLTTLTVLANFTGPLALPDINPGNGFGDYLISGFDLSGVSAGDRLVFRAQFTGATDGPDSFYLVAVPNQGEVAEPGTWLLIGSGVLCIRLARMRKRTLQPLA